MPGSTSGGQITPPPRSSLSLSVLDRRLALARTQAPRRQASAPVRFRSGQRSVSPRNNEWDDAPVPAFRRSADIDDAAFAVFGAPGEQAAVTAPGQRRDRCVA